MVICTLRIVPQGQCCDQTGCKARGTDKIETLSSPDINNCANECQNNAECVGYLHYPWFGGSRCDLYRDHRESSITLFYSCASELWASWTYDQCSVTCGIGSIQRTRYCCGSSCPQETESATETCDTAVNCPVDGSWASWGTYDTCSVSCSGGTQTRSRQCTDPSPQHGGADCSGNSTETQVCNTQNCPIDGGWSTWSAYGTCTVTCGGGTHSRTRSCSNPSPQHGGASCDGSDTESQTCNNQDCQIDGGWSTWSAYDTCSHTCGGGTQSRARTCSNPSPQFGGATCSGSDTESQTCNSQNCPIDGGWSTWSAYDNCTVTCGGGTQSRTRTCSDPSPQHGGATCSGSNTESQTCNNQNCPINGEWTSWLDIGDCSEPCGPGYLNRSRSCTNPVPQHGGDQCNGGGSDTAPCIGAYCPVDGDWSAWSIFSQCPVTCGGGIQYRNRSCTNPAPQYNGNVCEGNDTESQSCNDLSCPVDGGWSGWTGWGLCNVTCGGGTHTRTRSCSNPQPEHGGATCAGDAEDVKTCNNYTCPALGEPECRCVCVEQNITLEAKIEQMKNELTINRTQLSSTRRKLVCAEDPRTSATRVGLIGISFIGALGIFLVSGDFISVVSYIIGVFKGNA